MQIIVVVFEKLSAKKQLYEQFRFQLTYLGMTLEKVCTVYKVKLFERKVLKYL